MTRGAEGGEGFLPIEAEMRTLAHRCIVGIDEAGRGPLAGPVVAAAVYLRAGAVYTGLHDSKRLTARQREAVYARICADAVAYGIGIVSSELIDRHNILWATKQAMVRAVRQLDCTPDLLLIDGTQSLPLAIAQRTLVRGDVLCASIAAASVVAKVTRDRIMVAYARRYPEYGFERHKGYPTREHYARLRLYGPSAIHRRSFRGVLQDSVPDA